MTTHVVLAMVSFEDDAGSAQHIYNQIKAVASEKGRPVFWGVGGIRSREKQYGY